MIGAKYHYHQLSSTIMLFAFEFLAAQNEELGAPNGKGSWCCFFHVPLAKKALQGTLPKPRMGNAGYAMIWVCLKMRDLLRWWDSTGFASESISHREYHKPKDALIRLWVKINGTILDPF